MFGAGRGGTSLLALIDRPATGTLVVAVLAVVAGWCAHAWAAWSTRSAHAEPTSDRRPAERDGHPTEPPAVVALLTNDYAVPRSAVTATALDLAARGWIRLTVVDDELVVVTRGGAAAGDSLLPFEQQVLNHLASRAFNDVTSATTLARAHHRLDRRWWLRFGRAVADVAQRADLTTRRYTALELAPAAAGAAIALLTSWLAVRDGTEIAIAESWQSRLVWALTLVAGMALAWRTIERGVGSAQRPTAEGAERTAAWMGYRRRLRDRIPGHASVIAPPAQQLALAHAAVMGVAEQVLAELPAAPEDHRRAWSEAGDQAHVVRVRYPVRPGYGQHPLKVGIAGVVVFLVARWVRGFLGRVADGEALESLFERVPGQIELIERIAEVLAALCWVPIVVGAWAVIAGVVDSIATRERIGMVVRARRPAEVVPRVVANVIKPFAERDRFSTYLAVDDGRRSTVTAWLANERSAAPQGAQARVRATPLLGYVRSSEPVGTATRSGA